MKLLLSVTAISIIVVSISCNSGKNANNAVQTVDVAGNINNFQQVNLSQYTDDISYIPLELTRETPLSTISEVSFSENMILVSDRNSCFLFNATGPFIRKIGEQGRGPEEYQYMSNPSISKNNKIYFSSLFDVFEFNTDGSFVNKYPGILNVRDTFNLAPWHLVDDSLFLGRIDNTSGQKRYKAMLINKKGELKNSFRNHDLLENKGSRVFGGTAQISEFNGSTFFKEQFTDTLFVLNDKYDLVPKYSFNLGGLAMPASTRQVFMEYAPRMNDYLKISNIFQTTDYLILDLNINKDLYRVLGVFNKKSGELVLSQPSDSENEVTSTGFYNDIDGGPKFFPLKMLNDNTIVMWLTALDLKNYVAGSEFKNNVPKYPEKKTELETLANSLTEFDNPVLMMVQLEK